MRAAGFRETSPPRHAGARDLASGLAAILVLLVTSLASADESGRGVPAGLLQKAWDKGTVRVIVELGNVGAVPEGRLRSQAAVGAQRARIASDRAALRWALRGLRHRVLQEFRTIPYVGLEVDHDALRVLSALPGLATRVHEDILLRPTLAQSGPLINAPDAWNAGWDGAGQVIAIIDSGVDKDHPFLAGKVVSEACYDSSGVSTCPNGLTSDTSVGAGVPCTFAPIGCDHGTHLAGIAAGNGPSFDGIARGASIMAVRTAHGDTCGGSPCVLHFFSDVVAGLERVYELRDTYSIAAANLSIGLAGVPFFSFCDAAMPAMTNAIANLASVGIATVIASGNDADDNVDFFNALDFPACISTAISVGATSDGSGGLSADLVMPFSNSASFLSLLAPGSLIDSSVPGGGFAAGGGTSMAAPHVAGAWAIAKQVNPGASVNDVLAGLQNTGKPIVDPGNDLTFYRIAATLLQFSAPTYNVAETGTATITVTRSGAMFGPHFAPLSVDYATSAGTAIVGQDYTETSGTLFFNEGETSKTFTVQIAPDSKDDGTRTVNLNLTTVGGGALLGARDTAVLNIGDNDVAGSIQLSASTYSVGEKGLSATITVTRSGGSAGDATVQYATSNGTAHAPDDYQAATGTVTFDSTGPGATTQTFTVPIVDNGLADGNRTVNLTLHTPGGGASLGRRKTAVLTIVDDEIAFQFSQASYSAAESAGTATITVTRMGPKPLPVGVTHVDVTYTVLGGSATQGLDYGGTYTGVLQFTASQTSRTFRVTILNDRLAEAPESVLLQLSNPTGGAILGSRKTAVLTILDNDPAGIVKFSATGYTTPDADGMATITLARTGGTGAGATVQYATGGGGNATPGVHYDPIPPTTVPFPGNQPTVTFQVPIHGNTTAGDGSRTVELLLIGAGGGATLGIPTRAMLAITNNDVGGALSFVTSSVSVPESSPTATIAVKRTGGIAGGVTVDVVATNGTAKLDDDYGAPSPAVLTFDPGDVQKTFEVPILANPAAVASRSLTLKLQNAVGGGTVGLPGTATLTITKVGVRFTQAAYTVNEGGVATVIVVRPGTAPGTTVSYATENGHDADAAKNAQAGVDYQEIPPTQLSPPFGSGQTSRAFAVNTLNNGGSGNKTLLLHLSNASGEPLGQPATATLTILDTQTPELQLPVFTSPDVAVAGKSITVTAAVRNFSGSAAGASTLRFFLSVDAVWDDGDTLLGSRAVPALGAGATSSASTTLAIPANTLPGIYQILAFADATGLVSEQDELNNVQDRSLTVVSNLVKTFKVSGSFLSTGCASPLRNGSVIVEGTLVFSRQTSQALTGTFTLTSPTTNRKTTGPVKATLDEAGDLSGTFTYTTTEGSTTVSKGSGTLAGHSDGTNLDFPFTLTGTHATGETCDFSASLISPAAPWLSLNFHHRAGAGALGEQDGAFVATPGFPVAIESFQALLAVTVDATFPAPGEVTFTGPGGAAFSNTAATEFAQLAANAAVFRSPFSTSPPTAPGGLWTVHHEGVDHEFDLQDQEADEHLVVPVPTFVLNGSGALRQVTWVLKDPTGVALDAPPGFLRSLRVQLLDPCGVTLYDSQAFVPTTTSRTISPAIALSRVAEVRFLYLDDRQNTSTVHYGAATPGSCKVVEFSSPSYGVTENATQANITLQRVGDLTGQVAVRFRTSDGTATAPDDYGSVDAPVLLNAGVTSLVLPVPIANNSAPGAPKTVHLALEAPEPGDPGEPAVLGPLDTAVLTITDDEPTLRLNSGAYVVNEASQFLNVIVLRAGPKTAPVTVNLVPTQTASATGGATCAVDGADFSAAVIPVTLSANQTSKTVPVPLCADTRAELLESFVLELQDPGGATLANPTTATVSLVDNEVGGAIRWGVADASGVEGATLLLTATRTGGTASGVTVEVTAHDGDADTPGADAEAGVDYEALPPTTLSFDSGASQTVEIPLLLRPGSQGTRAFRVTLHDPEGGAALGSPSTVIVWILDPS